MPICAKQVHLMVIPLGRDCIIICAARDRKRRYPLDRAHAAPTRVGLPRRANVDEPRPEPARELRAHTRGAAGDIYPRLAT